MRIRTIFTAAAIAVPAVLGTQAAPASADEAPQPPSDTVVSDSSGEKSPTAPPAEEGPATASELSQPTESTDATVMQLEPGNPANCDLSAQNAHPSSSYPHPVVFKLTKSCSYNVDGWWQIWGDRSSWSGWRLFHGRFSEDTAFKSRTWRIDKMCMSGTYDYRTRGKSESYIAGTTYYAEVWGNKDRISSNSNNTACSSA